MSTKPYPLTPELDKMLAVKEKSQIIGEFLDQCEFEGVHLAEYDGDELRPIRRNIEATLAQYFGIDLKKCEAEREAILDHIRA